MSDADLCMSIVANKKCCRVGFEPTINRSLAYRFCPLSYRSFYVRLGFHSSILVLSIRKSTSAYQILPGQFNIVGSRLVFVIGSSVLNL
jgi:hypothetical protein